MPSGDELSSGADAGCEAGIGDEATALSGRLAGLSLSTDRSGGASDSDALTPAAGACRTVCPFAATPVNEMRMVMNTNRITCCDNRAELLGDISL